MTDQSAARGPRPCWRTLSNFLAFGFGSGVYPKAPGHPGPRCRVTLRSALASSCRWPATRGGAVREPFLIGILALTAQRRNMGVQ